MAVFHIIKRLCDGCGICLAACPHDAIKLRGNGLYAILPSRCRGCGDCMQSCPVGAVSLADDDDFASDAQVIERLRSENRMLNSQLKILSQTMRGLLENIPIAVLVADKNGCVTMANKPFIDCLNCRMQGNGTVTGSYIDKLFDEQTASRFSDAIHIGTSFSDVDISFGTSAFSASVVPLVPGSSAMIMLRNLYDGNSLRNEVATRIESVIDRSMAMIQKIGYLLGEEAAGNTKTLNSIIRYIEGRERDEQAGDISANGDLTNLSDESV